MATGIEMNPREEFGVALRSILNKNNIKLLTVAKVLGVSQGYISQVLTGATLISESRFGDLCEYLMKTIGDEEEVLRLAAKYTNARAGGGIDVSELVGATTVQRHFLSLFMQLTSEQQLEVLRILLQFRENNRNEQAKLAELEKSKK